MMTPLDTNPTLRKKIYAAMWVIGGLLGATTAGYAVAIGGIDNLPTWLLTANVVFPFVSSYVGYQASTNTVIPSDERDPLPGL